MARKTRTTRKAPIKTMNATQAIAIAKSSARKAIDAGMVAATSVRKLAIARANKAKNAATASVEEAKTRTVDAVNQLEKMFEQRVSRAIAKLGVPTAKDVRALSRQVTQLQASVNTLRRSRARASA
ncbi:phasin family protein [Usitatibacter palustris]|uniref:Poly(Hydroxyalkanoate) granule-associated protein n=1 Tax=Usitatibacter palustris TaxID=2732487 RepID=A0A6M4H735_9PROT|nr:phasin family protein [Usitatibacter palustris]QJR15192.1 hypothetical protein DSM104440_02009 [Usitatibacter palustris]